MYPVAAWMQHVTSDHPASHTVNTAIITNYTERCTLEGESSKINLECRQISKEKKESRAVARKPRDAAAVLFGLKFADDIHYKFKSSQASKARLQSSKHTCTK